MRNNKSSPNFASTLNKCKRIDFWKKKKWLNSQYFVISSEIWRFLYTDKNCALL